MPTPTPRRLACRQRSPSRLLSPCWTYPLPSHSCRPRPCGRFRLPPAQVPGSRPGPASKPTSRGRSGSTTRTRRRQRCRSTCVSSRLQPPPQAALPLCRRLRQEPRTAWRSSSERRSRGTLTSCASPASALAPGSSSRATRNGVPCEPTSARSSRLRAAAACASTLSRPSSPRRTTPCSRLRRLQAQRLGLHARPPSPPPSSSGLRCSGLLMVPRAPLSLSTQTPSPWQPPSAELRRRLFTPRSPLARPRFPPSGEPSSPPR